MPPQLFTELARDLAIRTEGEGSVRPLIAFRSHHRERGGDHQPTNGPGSWHGMMDLSAATSVALAGPVAVPVAVVSIKEGCESLGMRSNNELSSSPKQ
jgi:hypothetical protein